MAEEFEGRLSLIQTLKDTLLLEKTEWTALECRFLAKDCLNRFLIGCGDDVTLACNNILDTLKWRKEEAVDFNELSQHRFHFAMGKVYCNGKDKAGYPLMVMRPRFDPQDGLEGKVPFFTWNFEDCIHRYNGKISWLVDCNGFPYHYLYKGHIAMAYTVANMLANNYPERLGTVYIVNAPWLFSSFWAMCSQWLKPVTKDKVCFVSKLSDLQDKIDSHELEIEYGGTNEYKFNEEELYQKHVAEDKIRLAENHRLNNIKVEHPDWPLNL
eukprot:TRINITY_DN4669_c0_g1_i1.p1 TRINITY_DN4669_c0_g1~~TRINITY_DN4669_c0_g1_i1.p1  ORF type:complete len:269 (+),score=51.47 TRINITY_DN4669_c0_g1_i1:20-826(+)